MTAAPTLTTQRGFTLVELVVVIMILGILAATALPRFTDVQKDAHKAAVDGIHGSLTTAIQLAHSQWMIRNGSTSTGTKFDSADTTLLGLGTHTLDFNQYGWPTMTGAATAAAANATPTEAQCKEVWDEILQSSPTVVVSGSASATGTQDWCVEVASSQCKFSYQRDATRAATTCGTVTRHLTYNPTTGAVAKTNP